MPAMGINRRRLERQQTRARIEEVRERQSRDDAAAADAVWMIEAWNVRRLEFAAELARLRKVPFPELVRQSDLIPAAVQI